jgi:hypothetical protein
MDASLESTSSNLALHDYGRHLRIEFGYVTVSELAELFRALAVACVQRQANRVLIIAGDDEPTGERALRDALTTMILAGIPRDTRLAMVPGSPRVAQTYRHAERDFSSAGIETRLFDNEDEAVRWLDGGNQGSRQQSA